jgi:hypothetical protein
MARVKLYINNELRAERGMKVPRRAGDLGKWSKEAQKVLARELWPILQGVPLELYKSEVSLEEVRIKYRTSAPFEIGIVIDRMANALGK